MRVSTVSPVPICKLSRLCVRCLKSEVIQTGFIHRVSKNCNGNSRWKKKKKKGKKKEHLYFLSRIWQRNNWFGIHCHIQRHYLTWCLADSNRVQIERQCHREKEMSCLLHLPFRLLPFIASLSLSLLFKPERNDQSHSPPTLHEVDDKWQDMSDVSVRLNACIRLLSRCLVCSVGCWRAFCKTEGLGCRAGREPAILMIFFFFSFGVHHHLSGSAKCAPRPCHSL